MSKTKGKGGAGEFIRQSVAASDRAAAAKAGETGKQRRAREKAEREAAEAAAAAAKASEAARADDAPPPEEGATAQPPEWPESFEYDDGLPIIPAPNPTRFRNAARAAQADERLADGDWRKSTDRARAGSRQAARAAQADAKANKHKRT